MYFSYRNVPKHAVRVGAILAVMMFATVSQAEIFFVDQSKSNGTSGTGKLGWSDAFITLEEALFASQAGDTIRVAEGAYTPNDLSLSGAQNQTFLINENIIILGGYKGEDEVVALQRDPKTFVTVLSGDFNNPSDQPFTFDRDYLTSPSRVDNAFTVVTVQNVTPGTRLEGFIIQGGNLGTDTGATAGALRGGGMLIDDSAMDIVNCTFRFNAVGIPPDPQIQFDPGTTSDGGGAAVRGGFAVMGEPDYTRFINCTFHDNFSARGGALALVDGSNIPTQVKVVNSLFYNNQALVISNLVAIPPDGSGGAIIVVGEEDLLNPNNDHDVKIEITNCTITKNNAANTTGGLRVVNVDPDFVTLVQNSVFWGNDENGTPSLGSEITRSGNPIATPSKIKVTFTDVEGDLPQSTEWPLWVDDVIALDPKFVDVANKDFRVTSISPVLDAGDPASTVIPPPPDEPIILSDDFDLDGDGDIGEPTPDLDLRTRELDSNNDGTALVNMGAFESFF